MSDHYFFLIRVFGHVLPIEVDCICCLLVEYSRAANIKDHHIYKIVSIITPRLHFIFGLLCLLVEYSRAANIKDHHIVNILSIITTKITFHIWSTLLRH